jgi:hypothetical protein
LNSDAIEEIEKYYSKKKNVVIKFSLSSIYNLKVSAYGTSKRGPDQRKLKKVTLNVQLFTTFEKDFLKWQKNVKIINFPFSVYCCAIII